MSEIVKNTKVETPIDQRETFVSLRKSFTESGDVAEKLRVLYALQETDNEIEKIVSLRGALPEEVAQIEDEINALVAKSARLEEMISGYEKSIEENKNQMVEIDADTAKYQQQLTNVANSREFDSINKELENLVLLRQIAEKHIGEARVAIAERKDAITEIASRIEIRKEDLQAKKEELESIVESTAAQEEQLSAKRAEYTARIDERTLSAYDRIRGSVRNHLAVVTVYNENATVLESSTCSAMPAADASIPLPLSAWWILLPAGSSLSVSTADVFS